MHIFGCKFSLRTDTGDTVPDRKNFDSLLWAIVTVFQVSGSRMCVSGEAILGRGLGGTEVDGSSSSLSMEVTQRLDLGWGRPRD
jgi:hypothetical protein